MNDLDLFKRIVRKSTRAATFTIATMLLSLTCGFLLLAGCHGMKVLNQNLRAEMAHAMEQAFGLMDGKQITRDTDLMWEVVPVGTSYILNVYVGATGEKAVEVDAGEEGRRLYRKMLESGSIARDGETGDFLFQERHTYRDANAGTYLQYWVNKALSRYRHNRKDSAPSVLSHSQSTMRNHKPRPKRSSSTPPTKT